MNRIVGISLLCVALGACGGDDGGGGTPDAMLPNSGFVPPTETMKAYKEINDAWVLQGDANFACLNTPSDLTPSTMDVVLSGTLEDFQSGNAVPDGTMAFFSGSDFDNPFATVMSDAADGTYSVTIPTGTAKYGVKITAPDTLDTYQLDYEVDNNPTQMENHDSVSLLTANALPAFIGVTRTPSLGILAGSIRDCDGNEVGGAVATVSSTSGTANHLDGAATYYFSAGASQSLPVRHSQQKFTNTDSLYVIIELPPTPEAYLQVWGYLPSQNPDTDEMTLIAEVPAPVLADTVITGSLEPIRTSN